MNNDEPHAFKAMKEAMRQAPKSSDWILTLRIAAEDVPIGIYGDANKSTYYGVALARVTPEQDIAMQKPIFEDGFTEGSKPEKKKHKPSQQAFMLTQDDLFKMYVAEKFDWAKDADSYIKSYCGIKSKSELDTNKTAWNLFNLLRGGYLNWKDTPPDEAYER